MPLWPRQRQARAYFGAVGKHQATLILPFPMKLAWDKRRVIEKFSIHEKAHDSAARCFARIADAYDEKRRAELGLIEECSCK